MIVHYSEQCKVINNFGTRYAGSRPFKEHRQYPTSSKYKKKQEVNTIVHHEVDDILQ